jgi:hypothetical protein
MKFTTKSNSWICDSCGDESLNNPGMRRYRCVSGCDFDYCAKCYKSAYTPSDEISEKMGASELASNHVASPILKKLAKLGGLSKMMGLLRIHLIDGNFARELTLGGIGGNRINISKDEMRHKLWTWVVFLEANLKVPGFSEAFISQEACLTMLLYALGIETHSKKTGKKGGIPTHLVKELLIDPVASQILTLESVIQECTIQKEGTDKKEFSTKLVKACIANGVVDRLLLRIGELQGETARNSAWGKKYAKPKIEPEKNTMSSTNDADEKDSSNNLNKSQVSKYTKNAEEQYQLNHSMGSMSIEEKNTSVIEIIDFLFSHSYDKNKSVFVKMTKNKTKMKKVTSLFSKRKNIDRKLLIFVVLEANGFATAIQENDTVHVLEALIGAKMTKIYCYRQADFDYSILKNNVQTNVQKLSKSKSKHVIKIKKKTKKKTKVVGFGGASGYHPNNYSKVDTSFGNSNASSNSSAKGKSDLLWKPGFGHGNSNTAKDDADRELNRIRKISATIETLDCLAQLLELNVELTKEEWASFNEAVEYSPLLSFFLSYLFGNSAMSLMSNIELYHAILRVVRCFASRKETAMLNGNIDGLYKSIHVLVADNVEVANDLDEEEDEILNEANYKNFAGKKEVMKRKSLLKQKKKREERRG